MAGGKGGGSWKVAYADFVTAMMAFFLVMWIGAQDVKVRQSVANYFVDPSGVAKRPKGDGMLEDPSPGPVPNESKVSSSGGTRAPANGPASPSTRAVMQWIIADEKRAAHWKQKAQQAKAAAAANPAQNDNMTPDQRAAQNLKTELHNVLTGNIPDGTPDVYRDLIFGSFKEVNWEQVAEHIMNYGS